MSRASLLDLIPEMQPWAQRLLDVITQAGASFTLTSVFRTFQEQQKLYSDYLAGKSKYPAARPGGSAHEVGMAFDLVLDNPGDQTQSGQVWSGWGGNWAQGDPIHFEWPGYSAALQASSAAPSTLLTPGGPFYALADVLIGLIPGPAQGLLTSAQLATALYNALGGEANAATWYIQHPLEAIRDLFAIWRGAVEAELGSIFG